MAKASDEARAVTAGLKRKQLDDVKRTILAVIAFVIACFLGLVVGAVAHNGWIGLAAWGVVFVFGSLWIARWYYRE